MAQMSKQEQNERIILKEFLIFLEQREYLCANWQGEEWTNLEKSECISEFLRERE